MSADAKATARAIDALRRGWPIMIEAVSGGLTVLAVETADDARLANFDADARADILISGRRAATLKLANQRDAAEADRPVLVARAPWLDLSATIALADPALDLATPLKGPFRTLPLPAADAAAAALELARLAGVLPAFFVGGNGSEARVTPADLAAYTDSASLGIAARARLPIALSETAEIVAFRDGAQAAEHVALIVGARDDSPPLVRLHSECLTGDVLGSLKCDCGPQLHSALAVMAARWGILLYLRQEGRGIGLVNKLRAYSLQDQGFDTVDANLRLGFAIDSRDFGVAARMLALLGQRRIRLLTNNPVKVASLEAHGIEIVERVPHRIAANPHNAGYLDTKRARTGHQL